MALPDDRPIQQGQDAPDPSMEDILASIRRILNDGETAADPPETHGDPPPSDGEDVFLLDTTMMIDDPHPDPASETHKETHPETLEETHQQTHLDPFEANLQDERAEAEIPFSPPPLVAPETADATSTSMGALVRALHDRHVPIARGNSPTLEDIVRDEMRPLVKSWLDEHLPPMVERLVRAEIERVVGRAVG